MNKINLFRSFIVISIISFIMVCLLPIFERGSNSLRLVSLESVIRLRSISFKTVLTYLLFIVMIAGYIGSIVMIKKDLEISKFIYFMTAFANSLWFFVVAFFILTNRSYHIDYSGYSNRNYGFAFYWLFCHLIIIGSVSIFMYKKVNRSELEQRRNIL